MYNLVQFVRKSKLFLWRQLCAQKIQIRKIAKLILMHVAKVR